MRAACRGRCGDLGWGRASRSRSPRSLPRAAVLRASLEQGEGRSLLPEPRPTDSTAWALTLPRDRLGRGQPCTVDIEARIFRHDSSIFENPPKTFQCWVHI